MNFVDNFKLFGTEVAQIPCIKHSGAPSTSTVGAVGCFYMDTDTGALYKCTAASLNYYQWEPLSAAEISVIMCEASGTEIVLAASADMPLRKFTLDGTGLMAGESVDIEVSGKNLFDISGIPKKNISADGGLKHWRSGIHADLYTPYDGGTAPGQNKPMQEAIIPTLPTIPAGTYTISFRNEGGRSALRMCSVADDGAVEDIWTGYEDAEDKTFTLEAPTRFTLRRSANDTTSVFYDLQIERGSTATAYEPYKGGHSVNVTIADNGEGGGAVTDVLEQHPGLMAYKPTTVICAPGYDDGIPMEVAYVADTKTYIDNKIAELDNKIAKLEKALTTN